MKCTKAIATTINPLKILLCKAGPKMRKWYGEGERLPEDGDFDPAKSPASTSEPEPSGPADEVLVLDADSTMGEAVLTQLVLKRCAAQRLA